MIVFFLVGSIWGSRTAWRGVGFGFLIYFMGYGIGLGWQASHVYSGEARELWQTDPVPATQYEALVETLKTMSLQGDGEPYSIEILVQGEDDTALAWLLHDFDNVTFARRLPLDAKAEAVIVPANVRPELAADYVGQDFIFDYRWSYSSLNWTDFGAWLIWRESRYEPVVSQQMMLWIRKDIYGVEEIPANSIP
jgi:hypothetical protein